MDKTTAQLHLDEWLAADRAVSGSQAYSIGGRSLTRADAETIRQQINYWNRQVQAFKAREYGGTPGVLTPSFK